MYYFKINKHWVLFYKNTNLLCYRDFGQANIRRRFSILMIARCILKQLIKNVD